MGRQLVGFFSVLVDKSSCLPVVLKNLTSVADVNFDLKFPTECFYLTMQALHVSFTSSCSHMKGLRNALYQLDASLKELRLQLQQLQLLLHQKLELEMRLKETMAVRSV